MYFYEQQQRKKRKCGVIEYTHRCCVPSYLENNCSIYITDYMQIARRNGSIFLQGSNIWKQITIREKEMHKYKTSLSKNLL